MTDNTSENGDATLPGEEEQPSKYVVVNQWGTATETGFSDIDVATAQSDVWDNHRPYAAPHGVEKR